MCLDAKDKKHIFNKPAELTKQKGIATLVLTIILLVAAMTIIIYATNHSVMQQKTATNQYVNTQAYSAAEAGLEYGLSYLQSNSSTVLASPSGGFINYSLATTTLGNNSTYTVNYTNPTANDYSILTITSTGTSQDGTSTRVIKQQVAQSPPSLYTVTAKGNVEVNGHGGTVTGTYAAHAGGNVDSSAVASGGQIIANDDALHDLSDTEVFTSIFGVSPATKKSQSTIYAKSKNVPWGSLSGTVWVDDNVSFAGKTTVGSQANPVTLIIDGNYDPSGQATIYGVVYVRGNADLTGNVDRGALITEGNTTLRGNGGVDYNSTIISNLLGAGSPSSGYAKIPGSWKDF